MSTAGVVVAAMLGEECGTVGDHIVRIAAS
jgi:hypothetical protein